MQKSPSINKKELDIKTTKKVFRELSILLCFDLEPCYSLIQTKYKNKKSISYPTFKECLSNFINAKESKLSKNLIREHNSPFDVDFDYAPTNEDMVNNRQNILECIQLTDDINLIMLHRSLYILQKKFEQNKEQLKNVYKKYGEYLDKEEEILIEESHIPMLLKEIFNLNKFEISYVNNFKEAVYKEMDYCKEITIEDYIFNEFIEFIRNNRKRYNFIFREKRNNTVFNLEHYEQYEINENDDLTKEAKVSILDEDEDYENINSNNNNDKKQKLPSAKYRNKLVLEEVKIQSQNEIFRNINMKLKNMKDKDSFYSESEIEKDNVEKYSESSIATSNKKRFSVKGLNIDGKLKKITTSNYDSESGEATHRSNFPKKINTENQENIIVENENDNDNEEKESSNNNKEEANEKEKENNIENNIENNNDNDNNNANDNINENNENNNENNDDIVNQDNNSMNESEEMDKKKQLLFSSKKKKTKDEFEKEFYETKYKEPSNIKSVKYFKHYLYVDILPLIIADFISDERNLYLILDHSDDFRNNLSSTFDVEILNRLGKYNLEEISSKRNDKIAELTQNKLKLEKNIENYEKLSQEMKEKNQNITYILITLQKLKDFLNWLNTKVHVLQNDIKIFKDYEKNKKEKEEEINHKIAQKIDKKNKIVENYKQIKRDFEIRKFIVAQRKMVNSNKKKKLKPIIKKNNSNVNNSNNSNNNISNIDENSNSNNHSLNSNEMSEDYNDSFMLVENNVSNKKKPKFYYPKVKKLNLKSNYDDIMTEKKVNDDEEVSKSSGVNEKSKSMNEMAKMRNKNDKNKKMKLGESKKLNNSIKKVKINISQQEQEQEQEENNQKNDNNNNLNGNENENENKNEEYNNKIDYENNNNNNIYDNINVNGNDNDNEESNIKIENEINNDDKNNKKSEEEAAMRVQENKSVKNNQKKLNKSQKINSNIKVSKKAKKILKTIHKGNTNNLNNNSNSDININATSNNFPKNLNTENSSNIKLRTEANERIEKQVKKKIRYILKKKEDTKKLTKDEKRELAFKEIFDHYSSKNSLLENKSSTFDAIQNKIGHLSLNEYCCFCNDFKIPLTKDKILALYNKSISSSSKVMSFQEFKVSLISMSFSINDSQVEEINRRINIFIGKAKLKNKEKSRFEKDDEKEMEKNKEIIKEKMIEIENLQNKSENQIIEEFFEFLEIDYEDKYRQKMKGIYNPINKNIKKNELSLPKIRENIPKKSNNKNMKSNSVLTNKKKEEENLKPIVKKLYIGKQIWVKDMVEKEKGDTPKRGKIVYDTEEESEEDEKDEKDEKDNNLPAIESSGVPLFSRNNNLENKYFDK